MEINRTDILNMGQRSYQAEVNSDVQDLKFANRNEMLEAAAVSRAENKREQEQYMAEVQEARIQRRAKAEEMGALGRNVDTYA